MVKVDDIVKREKVFGSGSYEFNVPSILKATKLMTELNKHYGVKSEISQNKKEVPKNFIGKVAIISLDSSSDKLKLKYIVKSKKLKVVL